MLGTKGPAIFDAPVIRSWKRSVANVAALPASGNTDGDARVVLVGPSGTPAIYVFSTTWQTIGGGGNSFSTIQPITGTSPVASSSTDTLTFTSSDTRVGVAGNSSTDTINLTVTVFPANVDTILNSNARITANGGLGYISTYGDITMGGRGGAIVIDGNGIHTDTSFVGYYGLVAGIANSIQANAIFETISTTKGSFPLPRMTTTQRNALSLGSGDDGLHVYDITAHGPYFWNGTTWKAISYT